MLVLPPNDMLISCKRPVITYVHCCRWEVEYSSEHGSARVCRLH